jgi:hypothetical protein
MFDLSYVPIHIVARVLIHLYTFNQLYWMTKKTHTSSPKKTATNPLAMCKSSGRPHLPGERPGRDVQHI